MRSITPIILGVFGLLVVSSHAPAQAIAEEPAAAEAPANLVNPNPLSSLSLEGLAATRSFPLFTPSRTAPLVDEAPLEPEPVAIEEPVVDPEQPPPPLQLVGIVLTEATQTALLLDSNSQEVHQLASGDEYEGWSLTIVDARSVEFRSGERVEPLKMFESFASPPTTSAVPDFQGGEIPGDVPPEMMGMPDQGEPPPGDVMLPGMEAEPVPEEPPVDFDPALGTGPVPEEGPLSPNADPNANPG